MTERTRLPVEAGRYLYHPTGHEWWTMAEEPCIVRLVHEDKQTWILYRGFRYAYGSFPGTFTKLED